MSGIRSTLALVAIALTVSIAPGNAQQKAPSLYERLGGVYSIATVVDDFIERLLVNDTLNANPAITDARTRVPKAGLKYKEQDELVAIVDSTKKDIVVGMSASAAR